jgi:hypothetical protein
LNPIDSGSATLANPEPLLTWDQVPGVPAVVQIQADPVWSMTKSPTAYVPVTGCPEAVPPA